MIEFLDQLDPQPVDHWPWPDAPDVIFGAVADLDGVRHVGCFVTPAHVVLGLRAWDDAREGAGPPPWALFEVEKLVRMALRQSGLAFEALAASRVWSRGFNGRRVAAAALTRGIADYYLDITKPIEHEASGWRWRSLLTGALLAREGVVSFDLDTLATRLGVSAEIDLDLVESLREEIRASTVLPDTPTDYEFLNDLVVELRRTAR